MASLPCTYILCYIDCSNKNNPSQPLRYILMDTLLTNDLLSNVHLNPTSTEMLNWAPPHAPSHTAPRHALRPCSFSVQMHVHGCVYCIASKLLSVYKCSRIGNSLHDCKTFQPHAYIRRSSPSTAYQTQ